MEVQGELQEMDKDFVPRLQLKIMSMPRMQGTTFKVQRTLIHTTIYSLLNCKICALREDASHGDTRCINQVEAGGRGRGCGRGRNSYQNNPYPYHATPSVPNFQNYPQEMFQKMSKMQKAAVQNRKMNVLHLMVPLLKQCNPCT